MKDISFAVREKEVVGIIGRNGAGKSTLLKVLSKITYPTLGRVKVAGRVASLLEVGTGFHEELTGRENVFLNGSILGMKKKEVEAKLDAIVDFAGVERFIDTPIKRYSSGMRLRLGFAVAAHLDPDVLIIDEVLAVGDAGFQKKCLSAMEELRSGGRTVLFVSHNMAAVENLCSRCLWIDNGQVRNDGDTRAVIQSYMGTLDGLPLPVVRSGDQLIIRLHYYAEQPVSYPSFGFRLTTEMGTLVTDTSTWHHDIEIPLIPPGDGHIDLEIDCLNLLPARYSFSLWLTGMSRVPHPAHPGTGIFDCVEHCARLEVELSNVYRSGRVLDSRHGIVYFPQKWNLCGIGKEVEGPQPVGGAAPRK